MTRACFLLATTFLVVAIAVAEQASNLSTDKSSLVALKSYVNFDPKNILADYDWSDSTFVCNWTGVTCGGHPLRVVALNLSNAGLVGTVSPHLGNLSSLVSLWLPNNSFHGVLPSELSRLSQLQNFSFALNHLIGGIPSWFGSLPKLRGLYLYGNQYSGSIPTAIFNSTSLETINLANNQLSGLIPKEIRNLTLLKELSLENNTFTGEISSWLGSLPKLRGLYLYNNLFSGSIPTAIFNSALLETIDLTNNQLSGTIPKEIRNLTLLKELLLESNNFTGSDLPSGLWQCKELQVLALSYNDFSGKIPRSIGNLTKLREFYLYANKMTGSIPEEIGNLQNLENLDLSINNISGIMPPTILNISALKAIALENNQLSGGLPTNLGLQLPNLRMLLVANNFLSGLLPEYISNASKLTDLDVAFNHFFGFIPKTLCVLKNLQWLNFADNDLAMKGTSECSLLSSLAIFRQLRFFSLSGNLLNTKLPASFGSNLSTSLEQLYLGSCNLRGNIPASIANLSSLILLDLSDNKLSGEIPASIGRLQQRLQNLYLSNNILQGLIPLELCQLGRLNFLDLGTNMLSGSIPTCLGNLTTSLRSLYLGSNKLTSEIPPTLWRLKDILDLNLSSNSLTGSLPEDVGKLRAVYSIDLSSNQLSGNILSSIGGLENLIYLFLENNRFEGSIPDSFGNLLSIEYLDLSNNSLSGVIPKSLEKLIHLKYLDLSFNKFNGEIPSGGPFANFSSDSFMENHKLCGVQVPPCKSPLKEWILRYVVPGISVAIVIVAFLILASRKKRNKQPESETALDNSKTWRRVTQLELSIATNGFKEENFLGAGSFGSTYRGMLFDGLTVAIKVFNLEVEEAFESFATECEVLSQVCHRNLVKVMTCCSSPDFKALVLQYVPQGSLEKWLYSEGFCLTIKQRLNILIDVASALEYLHYGYSTPIVHCDLKPSNVLLDEDMVAHVADFGIAKLLSRDGSMTQTMTLATIGYMAPEYGMGGVVSRKGDVYSFGIMLMEIFTRKRPVDEMFSQEMNLRQWVKNSLPHTIATVIDANLLRPEDRQYQTKKDCISSLMELALACATISPEERIDMKCIVATLRKIKMKFFSNAHRN